MTDRITYGPYGERVARTGTTDTPFLFNGAYGVETDASGLCHMRARYYSVETRRFLNADPLGFGGGLNWYAFANGNPASLGDPAGLWGTELANWLNKSTSYSREYYTANGSGALSTAWNGTWWTVSDLVDGTIDALRFGDAVGAVSAERCAGVKRWGGALFQDTARGVAIASSAAGALTKAAAATRTVGNGADDVLNGIRLRNQLTGQEIAGGHAFGKHAAEFGFKSADEMAAHVEAVMTNPSAVRNLSRGRTAYWDDATQSVVIRNPSAADGGTVFKPTNGKTYFDNLR
jgi:RHS repeat-associated protein